MSYVLGLDPSLTGTGVAWIGPTAPVVDEQRFAVETFTIRSRGQRADTLADRDRRIVKMVGELRESIAWLYANHGIDLAVIEGPSHGSRGGSAWDRAGLWWGYVRELYALNIPVAICAPTTRIKWATGSGRATASTKTDVGVSLSRLWPGVAAEGDNEWDALALATIGAQHLGWKVPHRSWHAAAQKSIEWPDPRFVVGEHGVAQAIREVS